MSSKQASATRFERTFSDGKSIWRTDYFGPPPSPPGSESVRADAANVFDYLDAEVGETRPPQAFLIEQSPGAVIQPHFHFVDQFQVIVGGGGWLGRDSVDPITAHFASACTGYGPVVAGDAGLKYFTLRRSADQTGAQFLPLNRHKMRKLPKRNIVANRVVPSAPMELARRRDVLRETVIDETDGLRIAMVRLPAHAALLLERPLQCRGQSMIVVAGELIGRSEVMDCHACLFVAVHESPPALYAGQAGAEVLVLSYPRPGVMQDHAAGVFAAESAGKSAGGDEAGSGKRDTR